MSKPCRDCVADGLTAKRPAPHPGPRCATHHRLKRARDRVTAHERMTQATYGLAPGQYQALYEAQGGRCAICQWATGATRRLAVDHNHKCCPGPTSCGQCVRGLLCSPCNRFVGLLRDDAAAFLRGYAYLARGEL